MKKILIVALVSTLYLVAATTVSAQLSPRMNIYQELESAHAIADYNDLFAASESPLLILRYGEGRYSAAWNASFVQALSYFTEDVSIVIKQPYGDATILSFVGKPAVAAFLTRPLASPRPQPQTVGRVQSVVPSQPFNAWSLIPNRCENDQFVTVRFDWVPVYSFIADLSALKLVSAQNQEVVLARKCIDQVLNSRYQLKTLTFSNVPIV